MTGITEKLREIAQKLEDLADDTEDAEPGDTPDLPIGAAIDRLEGFWWDCPQSEMDGELLLRFVDVLGLGMVLSGFAETHRRRLWRSGEVLSDGQIIKHVANALKTDKGAKKAIDGIRQLLGCWVLGREEADDAIGRALDKILEEAADDGGELANDMYYRQQDKADGARG